MCHRRDKNNVYNVVLFQMFYTFFKCKSAVSVWALLGKTTRLDICIFGKAVSKVSCAIWRKYILSAKASRPRTEQACTAWYSAQSLPNCTLHRRPFLRYFQRSFVVINFQDWGSFDAATVSTGGLWKVRPWEEEKLEEEEEEEEKIEASRSCFFRSSRALRTVRSRGALEAAVAPAIRTFPDQ